MKLNAAGPVIFVYLVRSKLLACLSRVFGDIKSDRGLDFVRDRTVVPMRTHVSINLNVLTAVSLERYLINLDVDMDALTLRMTELMQTTSLGSRLQKRVKTSRGKAIPSNRPILVD